MENVILIVHLLLALSLIGVVLMQRSEGGGLGIGGGGGGMMTGRSAATALGKVTWGLAVAFIITSIALTIMAARDSASGSVLDRITDTPAGAASDALPDLGGESLLPPGADGSDGLLPAAD
ncbi:preprotein translocase, SecG subunit [Oceanicola granulosus HTCC2516]|uniref:Protein-export membrane protein SecG n=1 Tax=Oceanicola granulosus (strain ATCC BAA-861 / DSM 15982 / KCTC 12143 / HTCC2516) TaxID=314256 RepID=Q2CIV2_OCEGH|nr:preprotein translocase subunit SecG [Oceanicola granulosus]EAR52487.1 preprotein translocase, SecG subunit [Oceanicola granulosus HTCC2516]